jgi:hypothetical protein
MYYGRPIPVSLSHVYPDMVRQVLGAYALATQVYVKANRASDLSTVFRTRRQASSVDRQSDQTSVSVILSPD